MVVMWQTHGSDMVDMWKWYGWHVVVTWKTLFKSCGDDVRLYPGSRVPQIFLVFLGSPHLPLTQDFITKVLVKRSYGLAIIPISYPGYHCSSLTHLSLPPTIILVPKCQWRGHIGYHRTHLLRILGRNFPWLSLVSTI